MTWTWTANEEALVPDFDRALRLRDEGNRVSALELLLSVLIRLTEDDRLLLLHTHLQIGNIYKHIGEHDNAEAHFKTATSVAPKHELASLCLFHALWAQSRREEALLEIVRFVTNADSSEYRELLSEDYCDALATDVERSLARRARGLLAKYG